MGYRLLIKNGLVEKGELRVSHGGAKGAERKEQADDLLVSLFRLMSLYYFSGSHRNVGR